jgi:uncharacterized protein (DUF433 family)
MADRVIVPINYIERRPGSDKYRIAGKGVTVDFLSLFIDDSDWPVERICANYDLTPAEVHAAWSFYYDHKAEIDRRRSEENERFDVAYAQDHERRERLRQQYREKTGQEYPPDTP